MENAALAFNVVFPLFVPMALGYLMRLAGLWDDAFLLRLNGIVFKVFFSIYMFDSVCNTSLENLNQPRLILFGILGTLAVCGVLLLVVPLCTKDNRRRGALIQGCYRSNLLLFCMPVVESLCGPEALGVAAVSMAVIVPLYNVLAVLVLEGYRSGRSDYRKLALSVVKNPLIIGTMAGFAVLFLGVRLPAAFMKSMDTLAGTAPTLALMTLGGMFRFGAVRKNLMAVSCAVAARLLLIPAVFLLLAAALGFRGVEITVVATMFGSPASTSSFTMAQQMDSDGELSGQLVVFGAVFSVLTLFLWVFVLKQTGLV